MLANAHSIEPQLYVSSRSGRIFASWDRAALMDLIVCFCLTGTGRNSACALLLRRLWHA